MGKIGITCRQPFLGADKWIEEEIKNADKPADKEEKVEVKKEKKVEVKKEKKVEVKKEKKVEVKEK